MTGRVSHKKRQYPIPKKTKKSQATTAQQGNCHLNVFFIRKVYKDGSKAVPC